MDARERTNLRIAKLESQLAKLRAFRESLDDPDLLELLSDGNGSSTSDAKTDQHATQRSPAHHPAPKRPNKTFELIKHFFVARDNRPATTKEIREATNLKREVITNLLYVKRKEQFRKIPMGEDQPAKWQLKQDV